MFVLNSDDRHAAERLLGHRRGQSGQCTRTDKGGSVLISNGRRSLAFGTCSFSPLHVISIRTKRRKRSSLTRDMPEAGMA